MGDNLKSGDKVIVLAAAARSAGVVAGALAGAIAGWIAKHNFLIAIGGLFVGAIIGWIVGAVVGRFLFPAKDGQVEVTKWGLSSLRDTLMGNFLASLFSSIAVCLLAVLILDTDIKTIGNYSVCIPVAMGLIMAFCASLI